MKNYRDNGLAEKWEAEARAADEKGKGPDDSEADGVLTLEQRRRRYVDAYMWAAERHHIDNIGVGMCRCADVQCADVQ